MVFGFLQVDGLIAFFSVFFFKSLCSSPLHELYEYIKIYLFICLVYDGCLGCFPVWYNFEQMCYGYLCIYIFVDLYLRLFRVDC